MRLIIWIKLVFSCILSYVYSAGLFFLMASLYLGLRENGILMRGLEILIEGQSNIVTVWILGTFGCSTLFILLIFPVLFGLKISRLIWVKNIFSNELSSDFDELLVSIKNVLNKLVGLIGKKQD